MFVNILVCFVVLFVFMFGIYCATEICYSKKNSDILLYFFGQTSFLTLTALIVMLFFKLFIK